MSGNSDDEVFDYETICTHESTDKCVICKNSLFPDCGPYEDENDSENEIVVACDNNHRFHRGCIRGIVKTGSVYCPFPGCSKYMKQIEEMDVVDDDTLVEEYNDKINNEKKGGRRKRKSVRKTRKHKRRTYKRRTHKKRTYRRK